LEAVTPAAEEQLDESKGEPTQCSEHLLSPKSRIEETGGFQNAFSGCRKNNGQRKMVVRKRTLEDLYSELFGDDDDDYSEDVQSLSEDRNLQCCRPTDQPVSGPAKQPVSGLATKHPRLDPLQKEIDAAR
jgi:hypothetical protein